MDLKLYFQKVRDVERQIDGNFAVVVSIDTPDGGKSGQMTEVSKSVAGRMVADGRARLAGPDEIREFYAALRREREDMLAREEDLRGWPYPVQRADPEPKPKRRQPKNEDE
jgi:hypothetical protein